MPTTFPSSAPASQPVIELARERGAHYGAGAALIRTAIIHSFNASSRNEWEYRMASNNNNNKSTILLTHSDRQTTQPRTEWEHKHRERHAPQLRLCAPRAKIEATDEEREAGRQAGRQGAREEGRAQRGEGVGISGGPRRWVVSQVSCPATIVLFVPCVRVCVRAILLSHKLCPKFVTSARNIIIPWALPKICHQHQHTSDMQIH
jgi:hypothetical protein